MHKGRILIISDTKIQLVGDRYLGFNAVVLEIEVFREIFNQITWIGSNYNNYPKDESLLPVPLGIKIISLPIIGGKSVFDKLLSLKQGMKYISWAIKHLQVADVVHVRGPNAVSFLMLLLAPFYKSKIWWFKYANNWVDTNATLTWKVQRFLLKRYSFLKVTVNGDWSSDPKHIIPLENPCLLNSELLKKERESFKKYRLIFVGRLELEKGITNLLDVINSLSNEYVEKILELNIVGDGPEMQNVIELTKNSKVKINVKGKLSKTEVLQTMESSEFLILPSVASEGFPKVIAEAWSRGCLPITTDVSSIGQYVINEVNGFVFSTSNIKVNLSNTLIKALCLPNEDFEKMILNSEKQLSLFTYPFYKKQILENILCVE